MNCKPGDMAVVVRIGECPTPVHEAVMRAVIGRIVTVVSLYDRQGAATWAIKEPFWLNIRGVGKTLVTGIDDSVLQPIRGDKAPRATESPKTLEAA
ncbi:hypothetical protein [Pusillimonas noertemannii]|uniref:Uncharacterized protein n=1 Tax=Pusillimonas noertemannii TaxID=305977 RepID=A0A2U1CMH2_9BURK|nr:hypothetical protein [Pusillimonas noertemannii]NYT68784.1 hypothetical protein [Pusillimonas noertemannii]PVY62193.1 hypothetical protein C7440_1686 [Pusillimonas noertemannii]TFL10821.1 hypothetical protein CSC72_09925 [Pusillimonas noertemannii]